MIAQVWARGKVRFPAVFLALFAVLVVMLLAGLFPRPALADELRPSVVELREQEAGFTSGQSAPQAAPDGAIGGPSDVRDARPYILDWKLTVPADRLAFARDQGPVLAKPVIPQSCTMIGAPQQRAGALALFGRVQLVCTGTLAGESFGLSELIGRSDAIARLIVRGGPTQTFRLTADQPVATIRAEPSAFQVLRDYFIIGAEHILLGWDHLLFVIALVLLVRRPWPVVKAATAFTIAHSITLVATTLGYAGLPSRPVEALIALSIVFLAVEVALVLRDSQRQTLTRRYPWLVAFGFGLFHGFGFAGALADIGLPQGEIATALLAFNLGVEAGQLLVIAALVAGLALLGRAPEKVQARTLTLATYVIGTIGSFWLIERVVG